MALGRRCATVRRRVPCIEKPMSRWVVIIMGKYVIVVESGSDVTPELCERYGIVRCTKAECAAFAPGTLCGMRESAYGVEALCARAQLPQGITCARPSIEDVILFLAKGANVV